MKASLKNGSRVVWWGLFVSALLGTGCELVTAPDRTQISGSGGSGGQTSTGGATSSGGTTSSGATGGTGGTTTPPECEKAEDCAAPDSECQVAACVDQKCGTANVDKGTKVAAQTAGDCQVVQCNGEGTTESVADDTDVHVDGKECTEDKCNAGVPENPPVTSGTACGANGALYCDANGGCVGCLTADQCGTPTDCSAPQCNGGKCETAFTAPGTPVPTQVDGDCQEVQCDGLGGTKSVAKQFDITDDGNQCTLDVCMNGAATHPNSPSGTTCNGAGVVCNGAGACVACISGADCSSGVCIQQTCAAPTCMDTVKNGPETDKDCGGTCPACANGKGCAVSADCTSKVCTANVCQAPLCTDTVKNGTESDVDCGGSCATKCGPGLACGVNADCKGGLCTGNTCVPTCTDGAKNGAETDVDCGGTCATKCAPGKVCSVNGDCQTSICTGNLCAAGPTCNDGIQNQGEIDVDCGGPNCAACGVGKVCTANSDCLSVFCNGGVCAAAPTDVEPGNDTCGGAVPAPVPLNALGSLSLPTTADVDWFVFTAAAADVGKVVHVVTGNVGPGNPCDTVVEVFEGSCASLATLGGPSDDLDYAEDWLSDPLTTAGPFWVKVSYSSFGFNKAPYTLTVTLQ